jgi:hypothetical protein
MGRTYEITPTTPSQGRGQAVKRFAAEPCEVCGSSARVHRHHKDGNPTHNARTNIAFLCPRHHVAVHQKSQKIA